MTFNTPVAYSHLDLNGHSQTLAGINGDSWAASRASGTIPI